MPTGAFSRKPSRGPSEQFRVVSSMGKTVGKTWESFTHFSHGIWENGKNVGKYGKNWVTSLNIVSIVQIDNKITSIDDMPMKQVSQLEYNFIDEYKNFLQNNGTCVVDNFIGMYGEALNISRKYFRCLVKEY